MIDNDRWDEIAPAFGLANAAAEAYRGFRLPYTSNPAPQPNEALFRACADGERNVNLTRIAGTLLQQGISLKLTTEICDLWNDTNDPPLPDERIISTCESIARSDQRNHPERHEAANNASFEGPWFDPETARVTHYLTETPPEREWLIQGLLPKGIVGMVSAPGGSSKSQLLMQLGYAVAQGGFFLGRWQIGTPGSALMLCAEDEGPEIHRRLYRMHMQTGGFDSGVYERLYVRSTVGESTLLTETVATGEVERTALVRRLAATAKLIPDLQLIIIDPVSRFRGGEENSNEDATRFIEALECLAKATGATVLVAHHSNKGSASANEATQNSARGASALTDGTRWHLALSKPSKDHPMIKLLGEDARARHVEMALVKTNYTAPMPPVLLRRDEGGQLYCANESTPTEAALAKLAALVRAVHATPGITRRQLETLVFGTNKPLGISEKGGRELTTTAIGLEYLTGQARGALTVTDRGLELIKRTVPPKPAGAARRGRSPREKT